MVSILRTDELAYMGGLTAYLQIRLSDKQLVLLNHIFLIPERRIPLDVE